LDNLPADAPDKIIAGIRPEAVTVSPEAIAGCIEAKLENAQPTGSETILFTRVGDVELTALTPGFVPMKAGRSVWLKKSVRSQKPKKPKSTTRLTPGRMLKAGVP